MEDTNVLSIHLRSFSDLALDNVIADVGWTVDMCGEGYQSFPRAEMGQLLGCGEPNAYVVLNQKIEEKSLIEIDAKILESTSMLLSIWKNLQLIVPQNRPDLVYQLFNRPSSQLGGESIKKYLLEHTDTVLRNQSDLSFHKAGVGMIISNHNSVAEIVHYNLTSEDKHYVENHQLTHDVLLRSIEVGVQGDILRLVAAHIPRPLVADAIGTSASNLSRVSKKVLSRYQSDALIDLSGLWYELRRFFNFDEGFLREWVVTPLPALAGVSPGLLMSSITGRRELRVLLQTMRTGDFC